MKQRIGLVLSQVPGYSETFFKNKIVALQSAGKEVVLIVTDSEPIEADVLGCEVVVAPSFKGSRWRVGSQVLKALFQIVFYSPKRSLYHYRLDRQVGISIQQCIKRLIQNAFVFKQDLDWLHFGFGMLAVGREHVAQAINASMAVSFRGFDLYLSPLKHPACYDLLFKTPSQYHVLSKEMKHDLMLHGIRKTDIDVITPAIDVGFFKQSKARHPFTKLDELKLITVARLHWKKGLEYTLEALAMLKEQGVSFQYTIIGSGEDYERLVFAVHQLQLESVVRFAGCLSPEGVKAALEASDVYIQYSIQEGFCNAALEAQAMGLLCVVSNAEGLAENVWHEHTGWVVQKRQPKLLVAQLVAIYEMSQSKRQHISNQAIARVQKLFTLEQQQKKFLTFYEK